MHHTYCAVKTQPKLHFSQNVKACISSSNQDNDIHVITCGRFGGTFYVMNAQKLAILAGLRSNFYMSVSQKYGPAQNTTTQIIQQPAWDAATLPSSGFVLSLHGWASDATNTWRWAYQSIKQGVRRQVCDWRGWFPFSGRHTETPQKSERQEGSWPYSQNLIKTHNNQSGIDNSCRRDVGERACWGWSMWGDAVPSFGWQLGQQKNKGK